jgi:hypothetical protein
MKMSGEKKSYLEELMNNFNTGLGLGNLTYDPNTDAALSFNFDQLNNMDAETALLYSALLEQYSLFIQQKYNRVKNIKNWAKSNLSIVVAKEGRNYGDKYTKYEEKVAMVINGDSYATELNNLMLLSQSKQDELEMVSERISNVSSKLHGIYYARK